MSKLVACYIVKLWNIRWNFYTLLFPTFSQTICKSFFRLHQRVGTVVLMMPPCNLNIARKVPKSSNTSYCHGTRGQTNFGSDSVKVIQHSLSYGRYWETWIRSTCTQYFINLSLQYFLHYFVVQFHNDQTAVTVRERILINPNKSVSLISANVVYKTVWQKIMVYRSSCFACNNKW